MRHVTEIGCDRRAVLKAVGTAALAGASARTTRGVERADATDGRAAAQAVDTSLPSGAVLFDLDADGAYDATVERAPESLADDARPSPIRITSGGRMTVDYAASVVEPEGRPALGDLDRLAYDYRAGTGGGAEARAFGVASGSHQMTARNETTDGGGVDGGRTTDSPETTETTTTTETTEGTGPGGGADRGGGTGDGGGTDTGVSAGDGGAPDETFIVVENDAGRHGAYLTYHDGRAAEGWRTHDVLARVTGDTAGTSGWFEYTADDGGTFDDAVARFGANARLVRVGVGRGDGVTPTALDAVYGGLVVNDRRYRFPVEVARRSAGSPFRGPLGEQK